MKLREYQKEALSKISESRYNGNNSALLHMATGLGKTILAVQDVVEYSKSQKKQVKVLFTSHMNDILEEGLKEFRRHAPEVKLTAQTLQYLNANLDEYRKDEFDYIVYDEAHHMKATTFENVYNYFDPDFALGLTATPSRADGQKIEELFGQPVYEMGLPQALAQGHLAEVDYQLVFDDAIKKMIEEGFTPSSVTEMRELLSVKPRNEQIVDSIRKEKHRMNLDHAQTIVFCQSIEHAEKMARLLKGKAYHSGLKKSEKDRIYNSFKLGKLEVICTRDMFNEGIDIPDARLIVFLRSTASRTVFLQQLGRGLRKVDGKTKVSVLDFAANIERLENVSALALATTKEQEIIDEVGEIKHDKSVSFKHGSFTFTSQVVEILSKLNDLYSDIPIGALRITDLARKHGTTMHKIKGLAEKEGYKITILRTRLVQRSYYIDGADWVKLYIKHKNDLLAKSFDRKEGLYTTGDLEKFWTCSRTTIRRLMDSTGWVYEVRQRRSRIVRVVSKQQKLELERLYPFVLEDEVLEDWVTLTELEALLSKNPRQVRRAIASKELEIRKIKKHGNRQNCIHRDDLALLQSFSDSTLVERAGKK